MAYWAPEWPAAACFYMANELRMIFTFLNGWGKIKRIFFLFTPVPSSSRGVHTVQEKITVWLLRTQDNIIWSLNPASTIYCETLGKELQLCLRFSISKIRNMIICRKFITMSGTEQDSIDISYYYCYFYYYNYYNCKSVTVFGIHETVT